MLSIYFTHSIHTSTRTLTHTSVTHGDVSDLYMDTAQGGIWSFSPLSCWNVNTPVAWICQMSTWYFKAASWLWLFFPTWGGKQGCSALYRHTHKHTCMHTPCYSPHMYGGSGVTGWDQLAGPHINTLWNFNEKQKVCVCVRGGCMHLSIHRICTYTVYFCTHRICTIHVHSSFLHLALCLVYTKHNGIW